MRTEGIKPRYHLCWDRPAFISSLDIDYNLLATRHCNGCGRTPTEPVWPKKLGEDRVRLDLFGRVDIQIGEEAGVRLRPRFIRLWRAA